MNKTVLDAVRDPWSARLVMFALLHNSEDEGQQKILAINLSVEELAELRMLIKIVPNTDTRARLPLIDLAAPALKQLSTVQKDMFAHTIFLLVKSDGVVDLFEWAFVAVVKRHLLGSRKHKNNGTLKHKRSSVSIVIGALAYGGSASQEQAGGAFGVAMSSLGMNDSTLPTETMCSVSEMEKAVQNVAVLKFTEKERLLQACVACITHDEQITVVEAETLRAIGDLLDCPIPIF